MDVDPDRLQAWLRADGGPMTLAKGFAAGTPGFGPIDGKYGALALAMALKLSEAPAERALAVAVLEGARQVCISSHHRAHRNVNTAVTSRGL